VLWPFLLSSAEASNNALFSTSSSFAKSLYEADLARLVDKTKTIRPRSYLHVALMIMTLASTHAFHV
jgi:hypothetical protein